MLGCDTVALYARRFHFPRCFLRSVPLQPRCHLMCGQAPSPPQSRKHGRPPVLGERNSGTVRTLLRALLSQGPTASTTAASSCKKCALMIQFSLLRSVVARRGSSLFLASEGILDSSCVAPAPSGWVDDRSPSFLFPSTAPGPAADAPLSDRGCRSFMIEANCAFTPALHDMSLPSLP